MRELRRPAGRRYNGVVGSGPPTVTCTPCWDSADRSPRQKPSDVPRLPHRMEHTSAAALGERRGYALRNQAGRRRTVLRQAARRDGWSMEWVTKNRRLVKSVSAPNATPDHVRLSSSNRGTGDVGVHHHAPEPPQPGGRPAVQAPSTTRALTCSKASRPGLAGWRGRSVISALSPGAVHSLDPRGRVDGRPMAGFTHRMNTPRPISGCSSGLTSPTTT
jgi:hypothetical protein